MAALRSLFLLLFYLTRQKWRLRMRIATGLLALSAIGCLAGQSVAQTITFRFEGVYDPAFTPPPEYAIAAGALIQGEFNYDLATPDTTVGDDDQGLYVQEEPHKLKFQIGDSIFFQSDQYGLLGYRVWIENDATHFTPTRDTFMVDGRDSLLAASYEIDNVDANLGLQDLSAQAFEGDELPADLGGFDLDVFGSGWLFFNGSNYEGQVARSVFSHRFQITSIERILSVPSLSPLSLAIATGLMGLAGLHRLRG